MSHHPIRLSTVIRLAVICVGSLVAAMVIPASVEAYAPRLDLGPVILAGIMLGVLLTVSGERRKHLLDAVRVELNKLRRVYHLAKNLNAASKKFHDWFTEIDNHLYGYLSLFTGKDFEAYDGFNGAFRKLSYHVYEVPELETKKEVALYAELLEATGRIAEARQQIKELWDNRFSGYIWTSVALMTGGAAAASFLSMADTIPSRVTTGVTLAILLIAIDLLWALDSLRTERKTMPKRYVDNISRIEAGTAPADV